MIKIKNIKDLVNLVGRTIKNKINNKVYYIESFGAIDDNGIKYYLTDTDKLILKGSEYDVFLKLLNYEVVR